MSEILERGLQEAHLPALLMSAIHLTGDASILDECPRPTVDFFTDGRTGGFSPGVQEKIREYARDAIEAFMDGRAVPAPPSDETVRRMINFVAGTEVPEHYLPFLLDDLALDGRDPKFPQVEGTALEQKRKDLKVLVIGAGMSGLLAGIRLQQAGIAFEIIEKNAEVGGTWFENTYPGCRVDTPNHLYSYSFEPNHDWPQHYSTQDVLLNYFRRVADKYDLRKHIRFNTQVVEARFDEVASRWSVRLRDAAGQEESIEADAVISGVGQLNQPRVPDIPGKDSFAGPSFHSARWRHDVDLRGKRVACIGTGASAFQFIPEIAPEVDRLLVFQRNPPWLAPTPDYHFEVGEGMKWLLEHVPFYDKWYRFYLFWLLTDGLMGFVESDPDWQGPTTAISQPNAMAREMLIEAIRPQVASKPELLEKLVPQYPVGGKRALRDNGVYIAALARDDVDLITEGIEAITPQGVRTADGVEHDVDVIIYGTGFRASDFLRTFRVVGRGGRELHDEWRGDARAYLGMTVPGYPNFFMLYGPNTNIVVNGSIFFFSECSVRYIVECIKLLAETGHKTLEPLRGVFDEFNRRVDEENQRMAWGSPNVSSWYKNASGRVSQNWPFPLVDYWSETLKPKEQDFSFDQSEA